VSVIVAVAVARMVRILESGISHFVHV
jgi:hypothetical protein